MRESRRVAAVGKHQTVDKRRVVRESPLVAAGDMLRQVAGLGQVAAMLAVEAGSPGQAVVEQRAAFRRFRRTQHWTHSSPHNVGI